MFMEIIKEWEDIGILLFHSEAVQACSLSTNTTDAQNKPYTPMENQLANTLIVLYLLSKETQMHLPKLHIYFNFMKSDAKLLGLITF